MKKFQKLLSIFLIFTLLFHFSFSKAVVISAAENNDSTVTVDVRVESFNETFVPQTQIEVESFDLQNYVSGNTPVLKETPRAIHAIIRALESAGIDTHSKDGLSLGYGGNYIEGINDLYEFEKGFLSGWMYYIDNQWAPAGVLEREIIDGESIVVIYTQNFSDNTYSWFEETELTTYEGEPFTIKQNGVMYDVLSPVEGATILLDGKPYNENGLEVLTDSEGNATLTLDEPGTYILSADRKNDAGEVNITRPYAKVTVLEKEQDPVVIEKKALAELIVVAINRLDETDEGKEAGQYSTESRETLSSAINGANSVVNNENVTQEDVNIAVTVLSDAIDQYNDSVIKDTTPDPETNYKDYSKVLKPVIEGAVENILLDGVDSEWEAIGLAQYGIEVPESYDEQFNKQLQSQILDRTGKGRMLITEVERLAMAAVAIGKDPTNIDGEGFNLIEKIYNSEPRTTGDDSLTFQGNNGVIFALIALDTMEFEVTEDAKWTRDKLVAELLKYQKDDGSWSLSTSTTGVTSIDITAMALTALAPYYGEPVVESAIGKAVNYLSGVQGPTGGFNEAFVGGISSEATSQVIIGLTANKIDPRSDQFTKNGINLIDHLLSFKADDGGFKHTDGDNSSNSMATEQALQALVAFDIYTKDEGRLYDFTEIVDPNPETDPEEDLEQDPEQDPETDLETDETPENEAEGNSDSEKQTDNKKSKESTEKAGTSNESGKLPKTSTHMYNMLLIGIGLMIFGGTILIVRKRKGVEIN